MNTVKISKRMSFILRHKPESIGAELEPQGWLSVPVLLSALNITMSQLQEVVETNNKKRFEFNEDQTKIRASQGHSKKVNLGYSPIKPPDTLFHGTVEKFILPIMESGLKKMSRHAVHLSKDKATALNVGSRRGTPIILEVNSKQMFQDGFEFFKSTNGVWLTDFVPPKYISNEFNFKK